MKSPLTMMSVVFGVICFLLLPSFLSAQTIFSNGPGSPITIQGGAYTVATGDFNNDGNLDLVVISDAVVSTTNAWQLNILLGDGKGGFVLGSTINAVGGGNAVFDVAVGDFNGDGNLDLAVAEGDASANTNAVEVFFGDGKGGFTNDPQSPIALSFEPIFLCAADLNRDGHTDLVVSGYGLGGSTDGMLEVLLGDGSGGFAPVSGSPLVTPGAGIESVAVGDFNGDHVPDLAVEGSASGTITIMLGKGDGTFSTFGSPIPLGGTPYLRAALGDFNHDGVLDMAVAISNPDQVDVFLGNGQGGFVSAPGSPYAAGVGTNSVAIGDFNADGDLDMAASNYQSNNVTVLLGNGAGGFVPASGSPFATTSPDFLTSGDFDNDGRTDLAVGTDSSVSILVTAQTPMKRYHQCDNDSDVPEYYDNNTTLTCDEGCALTSVANLMNAVNSSSSPKTLDDFLSSAPYGYTDGGYLGWTTVLGWPLLPYKYDLVDGQNEIPQQDVLDFLQKHLGDQVVLQLCETTDGSTCNWAHYVAALQPNGDDDWLLLDPGWTNAPFSLEAHEMGFTVTPKGVTKTFRFKVLGALAYQTVTNPSSFQTVAQSPVELLVTDPSGRRLGNISSGNDIFEIPRGSYFRDFPIGDDQGSGATIGDPTGVKTAFVPMPVDGTYTVVATGTGTGSYTLDIEAVASDGSSQEKTVTGVTAAGARATYQVSYSSTPGSPLQVTREATGAIASLSATSLSFTGQLVGTESGAQMVTLTNTGDPALNISGITASGDFTETNDCGSSLAVGGNCTIDVYMTPTATGSRTGTLTISDDASGSPQSVSLSGDGEDFGLGLAAGSSSRVTVSAGGDANYSLNVSPLGNFNQTVALSCAGAPALATCTVTPASVTLDGTDSAAVKVEVTTTASTLTPPFPVAFPPTKDAPLRLLILALTLIGISIIWWRKRPSRDGRIILGAVLLVVFLWTSCGGGGSGSHTPGTPAGTYTLTISGSDGSLTHSSTLSLTVK